MLMIEPYLLCYRIVSNIGKYPLVDHPFPIIPIVADIKTVLIDRPAIGIMNRASGILMGGIIEAGQSHRFPQINRQFVGEWCGLLNRGVPISVWISIYCPPSFEAF